MARTLRIAAAQYPIEELQSFEAFEAKVDRWVAEAAANGAQLLVFPEYGAMELTRLAGLETARNLGASLLALQPLLPRYKQAHKRLAMQHGVFILGGSAPVQMAGGHFVNRARLYAPSGASGFQEKLIMTRFEAEEWGISPSDGPLNVFDIGMGKIGVAICYDSEFPLIVRALTQAGAEVILVPSCTDTMAGYHRVRLSCAARALENQCYVVQSPTVGEAPWSAAVDVNVGAAGVFAPPDRLFPADGVIASGELNRPEWVYATLDLDLLDQVRRAGEVLNNRDWARQPGAAEVTLAAVIPLA
jgi:predicted amidohydrolase